MPSNYPALRDVAPAEVVDAHGHNQLREPEEVVTIKPSVGKLAMAPEARIQAPNRLSITTLHREPSEKSIHAARAQIADRILDILVWETPNKINVTIMAYNPNSSDGTLTPVVVGTWELERGQKENLAITIVRNQSVSHPQKKDHATWRGGQTTVISIIRPLSFPPRKDGATIEIQLRNQHGRLSAELGSGNLNSNIALFISPLAAPIQPPNLQPIQRTAGRARWQPPNESDLPIIGFGVGNPSKPKS